MTRYLLGIDSGTSMVKSVVFDVQGREIAIARREMPLLHPHPDAVEVEMERVWIAAASTIQEVVAAVGAEQIAAVGISGTACGFWGIDESGAPVRSAILWNDGRAAPVIARWQADGTYRRVFALSGNAPFPGYPLSLLAWLDAHEAQTLARTRWLLFHKDWLRYRLTNTIATDASDISYFPGAIEQGGDVEPLLSLAGLTAYRDCIPPLAPSGSVGGAVTAAAAAQTGLRQGTPVAVGAVDVVSSALGGGVHAVGQACAILGTSFLNSLVVAQPAFVPVESGVQAAMPGGGWLRSVVNTSGTINIDWLVEELAGEERAAAQDGGSVYAHIEARLREVAPGAGGLVYLPFLNSAGIVSPFAEPNARGMFFGLSQETTRVHLMRAVYEGTALAMRDCFDAIGQPVEEVVLVGGGARSGFWAQMFADATGRRIVVAEGSEFGARGAALLAGIAVGVYASHSAAAATLSIAQRYTPEASAARAYDLLYPLYRHLVQSSREAWRLRQQIAQQLQEL